MCLESHLLRPADTQPELQLVSTILIASLCTPILITLLLFIFILVPLNFLGQYQICCSNQFDKRFPFTLKMEIKCEICDKSFSSQSCFILHIEEHYPDQKIQCDKQFKTYQSLKGHLESVHKKVKKKCDYCGREYSSRTAVYNHIKSAHENKKYFCTLCYYQFA